MSYISAKACDIPLHFVVAGTSVHPHMMRIGDSGVQNLGDATNFLDCEVFSLGCQVFIGIAEIIVILNEPTLKRSQAHYHQPEMTYHNHVAANYMRPDTQHQPHDIQTKKTLTIGVQRAPAPMCEACPQKRQTSSDSAKLASYQMTASLLL